MGSAQRSAPGVWIVVRRGGTRGSERWLLDSDTETNIRDRACTQRQSPGRRGIPGQSRKACKPTSTGPAGSVISLKDVHLKKAYIPILVRLGGSVISLKDVHPSKAHIPILVRLGGSTISLKDVHPWKA